MRPSQPQQKKASRTAWIIMAGAIVAVLLVAGGVVLLVTGKDGKPAAEQTPDPVGTLYTPSPTPSPDDSKGPNDVGVEVGYGIWFTPSKGWLKSPDKKISGQNYILQQFSSRGLIDGYYWVRQTTLYDAKGFAEHLADIETSSYEGVRIGKTIECKPDNPKIKSCYAVSYDGLWVSPKNKAIKIKMRGFVTAYQDQFDRVTATDAALEARVYDRRVNELKYMNNSVVKSF
ncbi:hypothetical protein GCM10009804_09280 [Kribbella hippodromi]|uniref:Uncharacterized protein n=1 Tax=Kribbella hippodromi TaxID=434347 RepID=A0ABP4N2I4_9ACTN